MTRSAVESVTPFFFTWMMMSKQIPAPISEGSPYMPVMTYTMACPMVMIMPNTATMQRIIYNNVAHDKLTDIKS